MSCETLIPGEGPSEIRTEDLQRLLALILSSTSCVAVEHPIRTKEHNMLRCIAWPRAAYTATHQKPLPGEEVLTEAAVTHQCLR